MQNSYKVAALTTYDMIHCPLKQAWAARTVAPPNDSNIPGLQGERTRLDDGRILVHDGNYITTKGRNVALKETTIVSVERPKAANQTLKLTLDWVMWVGRLFESAKGAEMLGGPTDLTITTMKPTTEKTPTGTDWVLGFEGGLMLEECCWIASNFWVLLGSVRHRCMKEMPRHRKNRPSVEPDNIQWLVNRNPVVKCKTCKGS
jgi:hypothetical protein